MSHLTWLMFLHYLAKLENRKLHLKYCVLLCWQTYETRHNKTIRQKRQGTMHPIIWYAHVHRLSAYQMAGCFLSLFLTYIGTYRWTYAMISGARPIMGVFFRLTRKVGRHWLVGTLSVRYFSTLSRPTRILTAIKLVRLLMTILSFTGQRTGTSSVHSQTAGARTLNFICFIYRGVVAASLRQPHTSLSDAPLSLLLHMAGTSCSVDSPLSSSITPSLFHSRLKTFQIVRTHGPWPTKLLSALNPTSSVSGHNNSLVV